MSGRGRVRLDEDGSLLGHLAVLGVSWSAKLGSSFGVSNEFRRRLADNIAALAGP